MRIGIDVSWAQGPPSGTATYITGLVEALTRVGPEHDYVLFTRSVLGRGAPRRHESALPGLEAPNVRYVAVDAPLTNVRQQVTLPLALRRQQLDLYHSPAFFLPLAWRGPAVVSMFDVNFLRLRENWTPGRRVMYLSLALQAPLAARQAGRIITLSRASARDVARLLGVPLDKIAVVPAAPRDVFRRAADPRAIEAVRRRYGRFVLSVGVLAPQKNLERMLCAFAHVRDGTTRLVLAGRPAGAYADAILRPLTRTLGLEGRVVFARVTDDEALC